MSDDERPRKSWREIDQAKDKSKHRQDERPPREKKQGPQSQKSYRASLDRLFNTGKIADLVELKTTGERKGDDETENRVKLLGRIKNAVDRQSITQAIDAYLEKYPLPGDLEILGKMLEHRDPSRQLEAMQRIDALLNSEQPKRVRAMIGQLKLIRDVGDDPEMVQLAGKLLDRLA